MSELGMPEAVFVVRLDDYQGFLIEKKHPSGYRITEEMLNLLYVEHEKEEGDMKFSEVDGRRIATVRFPEDPSRLVAFDLGELIDFGPNKELFSGMGRLVLELMRDAPDTVDLGEIIRQRTVLKDVEEEQKIARLFYTPSSALVLERLEAQGAESAGAVSLWLKNQIQTESIDIREAVKPLMDSEIIRVEIIGKSEMLFLLKDVFCYRAPPTASLTHAQRLMPNISETYTEYVKDFFSPEPPDKGYNPTLPADDVNSPIVEDREKISRILANRFHYGILQCLRKRPMRVENLVEETQLPQTVIQNSLWTLETEGIVVHFEKEGVWALVTNPTIETFYPEYLISVIGKKLIENKIGKEAAKRYLQLLIETWSQSND